MIKRPSCKTALGIFLVLLVGLVMSGCLAGGQTEGQKSESVITQEKKSIPARNFESEIKAYARRKWPDDYKMQVWEYNKQMGALNQIRDLPSTMDYNRIILERAKIKWGEDYRMVIWEYDKQLEAYKKMR